MRAEPFFDNFDIRPLLVKILDPCIAACLGKVNPYQL